MISVKKITGVSIGSVSVTTNTSTLVNLHFSTGIALSNGLLANWPSSVANKEKIK